MKATYKPEEENIEIYFDNIDNIIIDAIQSTSQIMVKASKDLDNIRDKITYDLTIKEIKQCMFVIRRLCELSLEGE